MSDSASRPNVSNLAAACIIAAGLIGAALIVAHRPPVPVAATVSAKPIAMPPIAQDSAAQQFRTQALAAPTLHTYLYKSVTHTLTDVKVTQVLYDAKNDDFTILYTYVWQPMMPAGGPQNDVTVLNNDGYNHYYGTVAPGIPGVPDTSHNADVTIR